MRERRSRHNSMPFPSGSRTSRTADVGLKRGDTRQGLGDGSGLADDLQLRVGAEEVDETTSNDFMIIDEEDLHHSVSYS